SRMAQDGGPNRQNQDRNGMSGSSLFLWAGLIVATGLLVIFWISPLFTREIEVTDLKRLIEANQRTETRELKETSRGIVDIRAQRGNKKPHSRYSNPRQIIVSDRSITGHADVVELVPQGTKKQLEPDGSKWSRNVTFRANIEPTGQYRD